MVVWETENLWMKTTLGERSKGSREKRETDLLKNMKSIRVLGWSFLYIFCGFEIYYKGCRLHFK